MGYEEGPVDYQASPGTEHYNPEFNSAYLGRNYGTTNSVTVADESLIIAIIFLMQPKGVDSLFLVNLPVLGGDFSFKSIVQMFANIP